jgi:pyruvate oxidase
MVGHSNLGLAEALRHQEEKGKLRYFGVRHEGAAAFAASAYGKLTGKPAACFTIAGPGATNLYTGLWDAKVDRAPILALTGQVDSQVLGTGNFQELDLIQAFSSVAVFNHRVGRDSKHAELASLAMKHALLRRDVAHLTFPDEIQTMPAPDEEAGSPEGRITPINISPPKEMLDSAVNLLNKTKRPIIIVGHGAKFSMDEIILLAEELNAPILTTFKGKGQISDSHPLAGGVIGRSGTPIASWLMNESDLILVFGASFSKHTGITPKKVIIQVDFDPMALSKHHKVDCAVWGEISTTVISLFDNLKGQTTTLDQRSDVANRWKIWRAEKQKRLLEDRGEGVSSVAVFEALNRHAPEDAVMCVDVGNNAYSFGRYYESKSNNRFLMSGYLGSIGFALPASIGAWAAVGSERKVIAVAGDGGFGQYLADFTTLVKYNMNVTVIIINNAELGKISKEQRAGEFEVWKTKLANPNFAEFARSCGALGFRVEKMEDLDAAYEAAIGHNGPALVEVMADVNLI